MINRVDILRKYHDQKIIITLANVDESLSGMILYDSPRDHCVFVKDQDLVEYYDTHDDMLKEKVYFKGLKAIEYQ